MNYGLLPKEDTAKCEFLLDVDIQANLKKNKQIQRIIAKLAKLDYQGLGR